MKKSLHYLSLLSAVSLFTVAASAQDAKEPGKAGDGSKPVASAPPAKTQPNKDASAPDKEPGKAGDGVAPVKDYGDKFRGKITAIDADTKMVTIEDKKNGAQKFHLGETSKIKKGKDDATWADLKVGEQVHGMSKKDGDKMHVESLVIGGGK